MNDLLFAPGDTQRNHACAKTRKVFQKVQNQATFADNEILTLYSSCERD